MPGVPPLDTSILQNASMTICRILLFTVKALSSDGVDCMLACNDTSAFDRQESMSKKSGKPGLRILLVTSLTAASSFHRETSFPMKRRCALA